jgi:hypothetical protein
LVIPESQHLETLRMQPLGALTIVLDLLGVLPTVQLDDQFALEGDEVDDVWSDWGLPTEFDIGQLPTS